MASHGRDTVAAGAGLCGPAAVADLARAAPREITRLAALGARLDRAPLHREGGHSQSRIVHAGGDAAGAEVHRVLRAALGESRVEILGRCVALDLVADQPPAGSPACWRAWPATTGMVRAPRPARGHCPRA